MALLSKSKMEYLNRITSIIHSVLPILYMVNFFLYLQEGRDPDYSEYKEFKLTVENLGFRMLMKMGWKEGEGLGSEGQGIKAPVNK